MATLKSRQPGQPSIKSCLPKSIILKRWLIASCSFNLILLISLIILKIIK